MNKKILFVCTSNVYRSLAAEYCLKKYLHKKNVDNWEVLSAGILPKKQPVHIYTRQAFNILGIKNIKHKQRRLSKKMLLDADIVIVMAKNHNNYIKKKFQFNKAIMFNKLILGKNISIWDVHNNVPDYQVNKLAMSSEINRTVNYINENIPNLYKQIIKIIDK